MPNLQEIRDQIRALQEQERAAVLAQKEAILGEMRRNIQDLGITAKELGFASISTSRNYSASVKSASSKIKSDRVVKYRKSDTEVWSGGRGPKPGWVKEIMANGGNIEAYRVATE